MSSLLREILTVPSQDGTLRNTDTSWPRGERLPKQDVALGDFAVDDYRPMKVVVIGAGISGILAGIRFRQYISNLTLTIYEREERIGGTWWTNRYPGVACDVPSHCYQYTFEKKTDWSAPYAPGPEIHEHLESVAAKYKLRPHIKLRHKLVQARWDDAEGKWKLRVQRPRVSDTRDNAEEEVRISKDLEVEEIEDEADILFMATGTFSRWLWPSIDGLQAFKGTLVHSANWNLGGATWEEDVQDWEKKSIAVIGVGASALQLIPTLQPRVGLLTQYVRSRTWLCPPYAQHKIADLLGQDMSEDKNCALPLSIWLLSPRSISDADLYPIPTDAYTEEELEHLEDPAHFATFRRALEDEMALVHTATLRGSPLQLHCQSLFKQYMNSGLADAPHIAEKLIPDFPVACRRPTPGPGYLTALRQDNVDFINTGIKRITPEGIETVDGKLRKHDVIICATGFDTSHIPSFPIIGRGGLSLSSKWAPHPRTYLGICTDGFPNCFFAYGPNSTVGAGSLLPILEAEVKYAVEVARKMQRERLRCVEVKAEAVQDFDDVLEAYFPRTVHTEKVRSWYKAGKADGRIIALWPGSNLHALRALQHPRWEDFTYERIDDTENRLYWLGNGMTTGEMGSSPDGAWFLDESYVDIPPIPT
ncbi:hypothetical protein NM688_g37 [Phlebia brevispora]|uniref:Uncharacterized protein n=1 Tax=Phlebia brevispora TaxID=194682 RepID=A0ACC1TFB5_9APHY|nr:hypothetical protein NM688_g37 [Phlebia brevispora]